MLASTGPPAGIAGAVGKTIPKRLQAAGPGIPLTTLLLSKAFSIHCNRFWTSLSTAEAAAETGDLMALLVAEPLAIEGGQKCSQKAAICWSWQMPDLPGVWLTRLVNG